MSSDSASMTMTMGTFHWTSVGDVLWFDSWVPSSESAYIGVCIALFILAILARGSAALQYYVEGWLIIKEEKRLHAANNKFSRADSKVTKNTSLEESIDGLRRRDGDSNHNEKPLEYSTSSSSPTGTFLSKNKAPARPELPHVPAFHWQTDTLRSLLSTLVTFINYLLMLVVMTGNGAYFIVIIIGVFVGEMVFGRYRALRGFHDLHNH
jgi:solute carrier family 31 (copper transporter), member 1